jgi:glutamyl-tRNA synthetase
MSLDPIITKHVLKNAFDYGKPNAGSIVGKVIGEHPDAKKDMKATMAAIMKEVARVSKLSKADIEKEMSKFVYVEKKEEEKGIDVPNAVDGKVVVRYPPEPNGWPHIGHAKAFCLSFAIAKRYHGKVLLRWDDTNPEAEKAEFLDAIRDGITWLGIPWDEEKYCSDYLPKMYGLCGHLLENGDAYSCSCKQEDIAKGREQMKRCACGSRKPQQNITEWKRMLDGTAVEGSVIIRLRGDMESQNTVMRDPTLFRIISAPHYRQGTKYRVWPTYDFQGAVMDSILNITHPIRSKEYELRDEAYVYLLKKLGLVVPQMISISRLAIKNAPISKRLLRPLVESGKLMGWDDPRMPTLAGMRRRGILPQAIQEFVLSFGISKVESEPDLESLLSFNRKILDPEAKHYFFVSDPVEVDVSGLKEQKLTLKLHPKKEAGSQNSRDISVSGKVFISKSDASQLKDGESFRLKDLCNVLVPKTGHGGNKLQGGIVPDDMVEKKVQWVSDGKLDCTVLVPKDLLGPDKEFDPKSLETIHGYCEPACADLNVGEIIQFERFGFCRLDKKEGKKLTFIFAC